MSDSRVLVERDEHRPRSLDIRFSLSIMAEHVQLQMISRFSNCNVFRRDL